MPSGFDSLQTRLSSKSAGHEPLAVIGIGCRLPGEIDSASAYWTALLSGLNAC